MTPFPLLWYYLWIAPHVLQTVIVIVMIRRKHYKQFPMFFSYNCFEIVQFTSLFVAGHIPSASRKYYLIFATGAALSTILRFGVVYEIIVQLFRNYRSLHTLGKVLLRRAAVVLLLVAASFGALRSGGGFDRLMLGVSIVDRTFSVVLSGLLVCLFLFSKYFGLSWRSIAFGIALGFGIFASVELASSAIRSQVGLLGNQILDFVTMGTYHLCVLIWLFYMLAREEPPKYNSGGLPEHDLETWNEELQRLIKK
jgi:hypothetical protein